ncbi:hypothetical protein [Myxococcus phage Mx1]|nr:hypothetical protein [Myxococcus phage Mx1]
MKNFLTAPMCLGALFLGIAFGAMDSASIRISVQVGTDAGVDAGPELCPVAVDTEDGNCEVQLQPCETRNDP